MANNNNNQNRGTWRPTGGYPSSVNHGPPPVVQSTGGEASWATGAASAPSQVPTGTHSSGGGARQPGSGSYLSGVQSSAGPQPPQSNEVNWPPSTGAANAPNQVPTGIHSSSAPGAGPFGLARMPGSAKKSDSVYTPDDSYHLQAASSQPMRGNVNSVPGATHGPLPPPIAGGMSAPTGLGGSGGGMFNPQQGGVPHSYGMVPTPVHHTVPFGARGGKRAPLPPHLMYAQAPPPPPATAGFAPQGGSAYPQHTHPHPHPLFKGGAQTAPSPAVLAAQNQFLPSAPVQEDIVNPVLPKAPQGETMEMVENLRIAMLLKDLSDSDLVALSSVLMSQYPLFAEYVEKKILFKKNYVAHKRHQSALGNLGDRTAMSAPPPDAKKSLESVSGKVASDFVREVQLNPSSITNVSEADAESVIRGEYTRES